MTALEQIAARIRGVEELSTVVRTMKALAAVNIRQFEGVARNLESFDRTIALGFRALLVHGPLLDPARPGGRSAHTAAVVMGSEQGFCGAFNERVAAFALARLARVRERQPELPLLAIGRVVAEHLRRGGLEPERVLATPSSPAGMTPLVQDLLVAVEAWRSAGRLERLLVFHAERGAGTPVRPRVLQHYPIPLRWLRQLEAEPWDSRALPFHRLPRAELLADLVRAWLFSSLLRALAQSLESENASRLAAMQAALHDVEEHLAELQASFRGERQDAITDELLDVLSGYQVVRARR